MAYFSNGDEGLCYQEEWCMRCVHWKDDGPDCAVWWAHLTYNYSEPHRAILDILIPRDEKGYNQRCEMFIEADQTLDMFAEEAA